MTALLNINKPVSRSCSQNGLSHTVNGSPPHTSLTSKSIRPPVVAFDLPHESGHLVSSGVIDTNRYSLSTSRGDDLRSFVDRLRSIHV